MRKIYISILTIFVLIFAAGCASEPTATPPTQAANKITLLTNYETTNQMMSNVVRDENIERKYADIEYLKASVYDDVFTLFNEVDVIMQDENAQRDEIGSLITRLVSIRTDIVINKKKGNFKGILQAEKSDFIDLFTYDYSKYPESYNTFYLNYVNAIVSILEKSEDYFTDLVKYKSLVSQLISYMDADLDEVAVFDSNLDFLQSATPFKSAQPRFTKLPSGNTIFVAEKGDPRNFLTDVKAIDASGNDISSNSFFLQAVNFSSEGKRYAQIAVVDDYGNTVYSQEIYEVIVIANLVKPVISVRLDQEIVSLLRTMTTDLRDHVDFKDGLGFIMPKENINVLEVFDRNNNPFETSEAVIYQNKTIEKDLYEVSSFESFADYELFNEQKYLNAVGKVVTLPSVDANVLTFELEANDYVTLTENRLRLEKYPAADTVVTLTVSLGEEVKVFNLVALAQEEVNIIIIDEPGTYVIHYQGVDLDGKYSDVVTKELIVLPPTKITVSDLIETTDIVPDYKLFDIEDLDEIDDIINSDLYKYFLQSNVELKDRYQGTNILPYAQNNESKVLLFDEGVQFIDGEVKLNGFHQMTYDIASYIDGYVPISSESTIVAPNRALTNLMHNNGIKVYLYVNIPYGYDGGSIELLEKLMTKKAGATGNNPSDYVYLEVLTNLAKDLNLDGIVISLKTGYYEYLSNTSRLTQASLREYRQNQAQAALEMEEKVIPFLNAFYAHLKNENLESVYQLGISEDGSLHNNTIYSDDHKALAQGADIVVTSADMKQAYTFNDELNEFLELDKDLTDLYKGVFAGYDDDQTKVGLNDFDRLLVDGQLKTSIALYNLSWRTFNIRTFDSNYHRYDPQSTENLYGSNNYYTYFDQITKILNGFQLEDFNFALSEYINPKTVIQGNKFYTNFNTGNGMKYFENGVQVNDFSNNKTWNSDGGFNNLEAQSILPTYLNLARFLDEEYEGERLSMSYDHNDAYSGTNSLSIKGYMNQFSGQNLVLYKTNLDLSNSTNPVIKLQIKVLNPTKTNVEFTYTYITEGIDDRYETTKVLPLELSNSTSYQTIELPVEVLPTGLTITSLGFNFNTEEVEDYLLDVKVGELFIGDAEQNTNNSQVTNVTIDEIGFNYNIYADILLSFDSAEENVKYKVYQKDAEGNLVYLAESFGTSLYIQNIVRYADNPVNPLFPTIEEYAEKGFIVIYTYNMYNSERGYTEINFDWPTELIAGGKAQVRLSSTIALPGEYVIFTPILSPLTESFEFDFKGAEFIAIPNTNSFAVKWDKEGYYDFSYKTVNPYGEDILDLKEAIIISTDVPSESDLTSEAYIDDSDEMRGIKYSGYTNRGERPSYLIDSGATGGSNLATKWCDNDKGPGGRWVIIDFLEPITINRFTLAHAASSTSNGWDMGNIGANSREYEIYVSMDGVTWTKVVHRENNTETFTEDILDSPVMAKHIKLIVVNGGSDITARVYDMRIFGTR